MGKELSLEQKAKRYDEAIERAKNFIENGDERERTIAESIFAGIMEESEDERIRKALMQNLKERFGTKGNMGKGLDMPDVLAWLEKQGDKDKLIKELGEYKVKYTQEVLEKHINSMSNKDDERLRKTTIAFLKDFAEQGYENAVECIDWIERQGEQKPTDLKTKAGNWYVCDMEVMNENMVTAFHRDEIYYCPKDGYLDVGGALFKVGCLDVFRLATEKEIPQPKPCEQKPTDWTEEDEELMKWSINNLIELKDRFGEEYGKVGDCINWLKSLKDRVQPQRQEWSYNDEIIIETIIQEIEKIQSEKFIDNAKYRCLDWLKNRTKSLRPQNRWKPSDEMLEALYRVIPENVMEISEDEMLLDKLYQGLKYGKVSSNK